MSQETSVLADLIKPQAYQQRTSNFFPSIESMRWYIRQHRTELVKERALLYIAGRLWISPAKFDACVFERGARQREAA
ncbi:MAG: hypothetical protein WKG52_01025 [Variovorax sp.]